MIVELTRYEPKDGRRYQTPSGELPAMERVRIDCVELRYTKVVGADDAAVAEEAKLLYETVPEVLPYRYADEREWIEAVVVCYRCRSESAQQCLVGIGYSLHLIENRGPVKIFDSYLGPKK